MKQGAASPPERPERRQAKRSAFGASFWVFLALAAATGALCWARLGPEAVADSLREDLSLVLFLVPKIAAASQVAALVPVLLPGEMIARLLGDNSGFKGVALASTVGAMTPGGPITSFPLVAALQAAGSGQYALIAFVTAWSVLGLQRILMWELPLMGTHFVGVRVLVSLPLPFIAAALAMLIAAPRPPALPPPGAGAGPET